MQRRKTMTMNWDGLGDDDDDEFFETYNRLSTAVPLDLASSSDEEDDDFEDSRLSFASTISSIRSIKPRTSKFAAAPSTRHNYDIWMAAPGSITERRRRLLGSMGLDENKELLKATSIALARAITNKFEKIPNQSPPPPLPPSSTTVPSPSVLAKQKTQRSPVFVLVRSRSEGDIDSFSMEKSRKEEIIGKVSKQRLTRTSTEIAALRGRGGRHSGGKRLVVKDSVESNRQIASPATAVSVAGSGVGAFFLIKNLDTGKEFIVNEYGENGMWNRLSDLQTGKQLTMEEFERTVGHSAVVKELMSRANVARRGDGYGKKLSTNSYISKSLRLSKRRGASLLKNIKGVASGFVGEREREVPVQQVVEAKTQGKNEWVRVRQTGKSQKELSALHLCQEFQAHDGCIWTIKFSLDGRFLASAGEDKVIHVWEVQECEVMSMKPEEGNLTPIHPSLLSSMERTDPPPLSSDKKKKGKFGSKRGSAIPDYVLVPETVFTLSEKPYCSFKGHQDEVLDLSWSKSQLLLSSSMDKTVRLWDLETKTCLKFFAHNDYVTCVQFNPIDDDYFISGSLDAKVRMWNIPARLVVDWTDIHEMVTAVSYTPDAQGVLIGTQKGNCRTYSIEDYKLTQTGTVELRNKRKNLLKKVTGFQFSPNNPSEVLVTSGDCRIKIVDGSDVVHKFKGFRNASSQIAASFTPNGRYIVSASEDSQVYVWKYEESRNSSSGKARSLLITSSHEHFPCKDVSVAIPWPCAIKGDPSSMPVQQSKKNTKRSAAPQDEAGPGASKRILPPLPKKNNILAIENAPASPENDPSAISRTTSGIGDSFSNSKRMLPPNPKKSKNQATESDYNHIEEELEAITRTDSGLGDSFASGSASIRYGDSPSNYSEPSTSTTHPSAWGMVIVTAGFGGEIRCYQNFGLPRKIGRQTNLFGGPT
ncbi:WD repeat-containing protein 44-like [Abrus precatorius]|uniref:WD repeat-containing protein 44-like n=1 Tax=Abrus precatorius TaxID=3816 RepID=A0A8B8L966_ABRPR|nr:WD repeat-containing protein 44-like [Abrus precatorius]